MHISKLLALSAFVAQQVSARALPNPQDPPPEGTPPSDDPVEGAPAGAPPFGDKKSFEDLQFDCSPADNPNGPSTQKKYNHDKWEELDVSGYLKHWYENKKPSEGALFGDGGGVPGFPDVFATEAAPGLGFRCIWGDCASKSCDDAQRAGVDPRAYLVTDAVANVHTNLQNLVDTINNQFVRQSFDSGPIVDLVMDAVIVPKADESGSIWQTILTVLSVVGGVSAAVTGPFSPAAAAALGGIGALGGASGFIEDGDEPEPPITKADVKDNINMVLGQSMKIYSELISGTFTKTLIIGESPNIDLHEDPNRSRAAEEMATFLQSELFWDLSAGKPLESSMALDLGMSRASLNGALQASKHFVVRNAMPKDFGWPTEKWVGNCEKLAGGWADTANGFCYSLQAMRTDNSWPYSDQSSFGSILRNADDPFTKKFGIKHISDFYTSLDHCSSANQGKPYLDFPKPEGNGGYGSYFHDILEAAKNNPSNIAPCTFNIPVLNRYSICDKHLDPEFPFRKDDKPACKESMSGEWVYMSFDMDVLLNAIASGEKECDPKENYLAMSEIGNKEMDSTIMCTNKKPDEEKEKERRWISR